MMGLLRACTSAGACLDKGAIAMPDTDLDDDLDLSPEDEADPLVKKLRAAVDRKDAKAKEASSRADTAERRLALLEAGIDLKSDLGGLFAEAYKGPSTAEGVREAAVKYPGLLPAEVPDPDTAAAERIAEAARGADMSDSKGQLSRESLKTMTPEAIVQAKEEGRLDKVLGIAP